MEVEVKNGYQSANSGDNLETTNNGIETINPLRAHGLNSVGTRRSQHGWCFSPFIKNIYSGVNLLRR
jgi:hypothetical protein